MLINCLSCGETVRTTTRLTKHCKNRSCLSKFIKGDNITFLNASHLKSIEIHRLHERGETFKIIQGIYFRVNFKSELNDLMESNNLFRICQTKGVTP